MSNPDPKDVHYFANAFLIPNNYNRSLAGYLKIIAEARKDFPDLKDEDINCLKVVRSSHCLHMPIIQFRVPVGTERPDYRQCNPRLPDIEWD